MLNEALGAAKTGSAREETKASGYRERLRPTSGHNEREHATGRRHLRRGKPIAGVASKPGVMDSLYLRMFGQEGRYGRGVAAVRAHPPGQRANTPQYQP
jgi:hypothetical protein